MDVAMVFSGLIMQLIALAQPCILMRLPLLNMHGAADGIGAKRQLADQPVGRYFSSIREAPARRAMPTLRALMLKVRTPWATAMA